MPPRDGSGRQNGTRSERAITPRPAREIMEALAPAGSSPGPAAPSSAPAAVKPAPGESDPAAARPAAPPSTSRDPEDLASSAGCRHFQADDGEWIARKVGQGGYGTGSMGVAHLEAIHFSRADSPAGRVREVLAPRCDLWLYFDDELRRLLARAVPLSENGRDAEPGRPV
jgi:hypothetical protein